MDEERYMLAGEEDLLNQLKSFNVLWGDPELYEI